MPYYKKWYKSYPFPFPSPIAQLVVITRTWEQEVAGSIPDSANILSEDWWWSLQQGSFLSHHCPLFRQSLCGKAASDLERILCGVLAKRTPGKYGQVHWLHWYNFNTVRNGIKHHTINLLPLLTQSWSLTLLVQIETICWWQNKISEMMIYILDKVENIVGSFSHNIFRRPYCLRVLKSRNCMAKAWQLS